MRRITNRPGLDAVAYRTGTHESVKRAMLARLGEVAPGLTTRDDDDLAVALVDAFATLADLVTFYQERHQNETWLRTATERLSVVELARLVGYQPRPGLAAEAALAFTVDGARDEPVTIPAGTAVQSTPAPGERPQVFETVEDVPARAAWNALRPRLFRAGYPSGGTITFPGATVVTPGDGVLWEVAGKPVFGVVTTVDQQPERPAARGRAGRPARTVVTVRPIGGGASRRVTGLRGAAPATGPLAAPYAGRSVPAADLAAEAATKRFAVADLFATLRANRRAAASALVFRGRASVFGHNAPPFSALPDELRSGRYGRRGGRWADERLDRYDTLADDAAVVFADTHQREPGDIVVLRDGERWDHYTVTAAADVTRAAFAIAGPATRLDLDRADGLGSFGIRTTSVYLRAEAVPFAEVAVDDALAGAEILLGDWVDGLREGLRVAVEGESHADRGTRVRHVTTLAAVVHDMTYGTRVTLADPLPATLVTDTVTVNANVARATHGQAVTEVLGSGDGRSAFQEFALKQPPLTYLGAANGAGARSTLTVWVDDVAWTEVPTLHDRRPDERVYVLRHGDDGTTYVCFGDGRTGARLPTGERNVRAAYRRGSGLGGLVKADQLDLPMSRPVPITAVANPLPSSGADDPERIEDARRNAPLPIRTLGRVVSLRDYEDFARAFPGVAKARAVWVPGVRRGVVVTVAGPRGELPGAVVTGNLLGALREQGDPYVPVRVLPFVPRSFRLGAELAVDSARERDVVVRAVEAALRAAYGFDARDLGQPVAVAEVLATIHAVPGVVAARLTALHRSDSPAAVATVPAASPRDGSDTPHPAELVALDPAPLPLGVLA